MNMKPPLPHLPGANLSTGTVEGQDKKSSDFLVGHGRKMEWCEACVSHHVIPVTPEEHKTLGCKAEFCSPKEPENDRLYDLELCCKLLRDGLLASNAVIHDMGGVTNFGTTGLQAYDRLFPAAKKAADTQTDTGLGNPQ